MIKNIILDWSGTLADDFQFTLKATNETLKKFGAPAISYEEYKRELTIPVDKFYARYLPATNIQTIDNFFFQWYLENAAQVTLFNHIEALLQCASSLQINLFICSTLDTKILDTVTTTKKIKHHFKAIYGNCFNKIEALSRIILREKIPVQESIYIGDTPHDIEAAKHANIRSGAALYGYTSPSVLTQSLANEYYRTPKELLYKTLTSQTPEYSKKPITTIGGFIFNLQNQILLTKSNKWSNKWGIPGGKIKYKETAQAAFIREIQEETNLELTNIKLLTTIDCIEDRDYYQPDHFVIICYTANTNSTNVIINHEATEFQWVSIEQTQHMSLNNPTRILLERLTQ